MVFSYKKSFLLLLIEFITLVSPSFFVYAVISKQLNLMRPEFFKLLVIVLSLPVEYRQQDQGHC